MAASKGWLAVQRQTVHLADRSCFVGQVVRISDQSQLQWHGVGEYALDPRVVE
jgi:hypothetical protein